MVAAIRSGAVGWSRRYLTGWLLVLGGWMLTSAACGSVTKSGPAAAWAQGPVRWLMLPEEQRQCRRLRSRREAVLFIELFWRRRDPTPSDPGNPLLQTFHDRVQAADKLYAEEGVRGALTDRGRALILLGPPPVLRQRVRTVTLATSPEDDVFGLEISEQKSREVQRTLLKDWQYPTEHLEPELRELLDEEERQAGIVLTFVEGSKRTELIEGERYLELAAEAIASQPLR